VLSDAIVAAAADACVRIVRAEASADAKPEPYIDMNVGDYENPEVDC